MAEFLLFLGLASLGEVAILGFFLFSGLGWVSGETELSGVLVKFFEEDCLAEWFLEMIRGLELDEIVRLLEFTTRFSKNFGFFSESTESSEFFLADN